MEVLDTSRQLTGNGGYSITPALSKSFSPEGRHTHACHNAAAFLHHLEGSSAAFRSLADSDVDVTVIQILQACAASGS